MLKIISFCLFGFLFLGCSAKPIINTQIQEVFIPTKCNVEMPKKPLENGSFQSHKELSIYYLKVENLLKQCLSK